MGCFIIEDIGNSFIRQFFAGPEGTVRRKS